MASNSSFYLRFVKKEKVSKDAYTFYFDRFRQKIDFLPGQFTQIFLPIEDRERGNSRYFTISSSPLNREFITITTRIIQSKFKKTLFELVPETEVKFIKPSGEFVFREEETENRIFLAGGIGVTPFHSMITYIAAKKITTPVILLASFSTVEDAVFYDEFRQISKSNNNIKIVYTITKPEESKTPWTGEIGRISDKLIKKYATDIAHSSFWIAGPPAMVTSIFEIVNLLGVQKEKIHRENFTGY
ncbi:MAG: FAD-dependent oxidoreductase [Patescibacteria group bacterium]|nr:FAD-dependent oxidoreductase [Patescibacteria group bacterium]